LAEIKLEKEPIDYEVNCENLYLFTQNEKCCTISMYNHNLEIVQNFGQENSMLPFYFSSKSDLFLVSNQYFIITELLIKKDFRGNHNRITIMNRSNGLVKASFSIYEDFHYIQLYLDTYLITFNNNACLLKCYNFKGDLLHKITLDKKLEGSDICVINKEIYFVSDNKIIFVF